MILLIINQLKDQDRRMQYQNQLREERVLPSRLTYRINSSCNSNLK